jgi:hypothetical protein
MVGGGSRRRDDEMSDTTTRELSDRTVREHRTRDELRTASAVLEHRIAAAVRCDYPDLCGWRRHRPASYRVVRTGPRADDWRWGAYRSAAAESAALRRWIAEAPGRAAGRISEAYGLGAGSEWAARHGFVAGPPSDSRAEAQVLASLRAVRS